MSPKRRDTPAHRAIAAIGWLLAAVGVVGLIVKPDLLILWVALIAFRGGPHSTGAHREVPRPQPRLTTPPRPGPTVIVAKRGWVPTATTTESRCR